MHDCSPFFWISEAFFIFSFDLFRAFASGCPSVNRYSCDVLFSEFLSRFGRGFAYSVLPNPPSLSDGVGLDRSTHSWPNIADFYGAFFFVQPTPLGSEEGATWVDRLFILWHRIARLFVCNLLHFCRHILDAHQPPPPLLLVCRCAVSFIYCFCPLWVGSLSFLFLRSLSAS